jgi:uncharacterized protein YndB with AHSA1/START domain
MAKTTLIAEPGKHEIIMTRAFDAPRELVFKTYTDPNLISQWWGSEDSTMIVDKLDVQKGGMWRFINREADGSEYAFNGVYHEVSSPDRLVYTFEFEGMPGHVLLETVRFEEQDGKTLLRNSSVFQSIEDRDGMLQSGMEEGADKSMDRLEKLLAKATTPRSR